MDFRQSIGGNRHLDSLLPGDRNSQLEDTGDRNSA
jgi:hypothetical protein